MKTLISFVSLAILFSSCVTGTTLRTARVLNEGQFEISAGLAGRLAPDSQIVIVAYGLSENVEIEGRCEDEFVALTPRVQLLRSEKSYVDCLTFFELGYSNEGGFQWGPGVVIGRRWNLIEPYVSYRFRHFNSYDEKNYGWFYEDKDSNIGHIEYSSYHYVKFGSRIYLPFLWNNSKRRSWFIGAECGPIFVRSEVEFEYGANIGFDY